MQAAKNFGLLTDLDKLQTYVSQVQERGLKLGFDVETGYHGPDRKKGALKVDWGRQFVCGFSLSHDPDFARYVPLHHDAGGNVEDPAAAWDIMRPILTQGTLVIHHKKFERRNVQKAAGYVLGSDGGKVIDSMLDAYVLSEFGLQGSNGAAPLRAANGLKDLTKILFDYDQAHIQSLFPGYTAKQIEALRFNVLELTPEVVNYCCDDAAWALALERRYGDKAESERKTMRRIEHEISDIMADVERHGVHIEWAEMEQALGESKTFVPAMMRSVKDGLSEMAGKDLTAMSLNSPKQMQALLYRDIGLRTTRMTKGAKDGKEPWEKMSTDAIAMEGLSKKHPAIRKLLDLREVENLSRRLEKWLAEFRYAEDDRVHANYNQVTVGTGRFAANDPPIQQCPKEWRWSTVNLDCWKFDQETEAYVEWQALVDREGSRNGAEYWTGNFRDFISAGYVFIDTAKWTDWNGPVIQEQSKTYLLTYDYSQIELRVLAGETQEPALLRAFNEDIDVHTMTAAMMLGKKPEAVDKKTERPIGKTMNFALLYGMGPKSLAERLAITMERAKELYAQYFAAFSRIASWQDAMTERGLRNGYSETRFGRKYTVWELQSSNRAIAAKGERVLTNAPIQGGAADYMKMAMIRVTKVLKERGWWMNGCTIIMNQHDSLTFEVSNELDPAMVKQALESAVVFPVPGFPKVVADWELGQRWGSSTAWKGKVHPEWDGEEWALVNDADCTCQATAPTLTVAPEPEVWDNGSTPSAEEPADLITSMETPAAEGKTLIETKTTLTREALQGLIRYIRERPGEEETWLTSPQGQLRVGRSSISKDDVGAISLLLGGATIRREASTEDLAQMASGLT